MKLKGVVLNDGNEGGRGRSLLSDTSALQKFHSVFRGRGGEEGMMMMVGFLSKQLRNTLQINI